MTDGINPPKPLISIEDYLPEGITPAQNGMMPAPLLRKVYCGGRLYVDAARSWNAMVRAAAEDKVFLNLNHPVNAYKDILQQRRLFQDRFSEVDAQADVPDGAVRVQFEDKIWQLKEGKAFTECPGTSSHGYGLAVFIVNAGLPSVRDWLNKNAAQFGFAREYDFLRGRYVYIRAHESVPERVLAIESLDPEPTFSAAQVVRQSDCKWLKTPSDDWTCNGIIRAMPIRVGALAVVDQGSGVGIKEDIIRVTFRQLAGLICTDPEPFVKLDRPILITSNVEETIQKLSALFNGEATKEQSFSVETEEEMRAEQNLYRKANPETVIFRRKKKMAQRLLEISVDELKKAPEQPWYKEYLALLAIRIKEPALCLLGKKFVDELMRWYDQHIRQDARELALVGALQFVKPTEFRVPFSQHLWHKEMIVDVRGIFLNFFTRVGYSDEDITTFYLAQQQKWKHGKRKMRVAFLFHSHAKGSKILPVYDAMRERDDIEAFIVLHPSSDYQHLGRYYKYFREQYPEDELYDINSLMDLRQAEPDYVFLQSPYEYRRQLPSIAIGDIIKYAKICHISYGATLSHTFADRLMDDFPEFYRNIRLMFCSAASVKTKIEKRYPENVELGYQYFEFLGYPSLDTPRPEIDEHSTKRILWTPRWSYSERVGGSHFLEYKDKFVELRDRYGDKVELSMRPHMNTFRTLLAKGAMTSEELAAYKNTLKEKSITLYSTFIDLDENFRDKDILLGDYSSILPVFFLTGRPMIYCEFPNAVFFDEYKEMYECLYIAHNWDEVLHYLDDLVSGNDPLYERRQAAVAKIRALHANSAQRIVDRIVEDFKQSEDSNL